MTNSQSQAVNSTGIARLTAEVRVNQFTNNDQQDAKLLHLADGRVAFSYTTEDNENGDSGESIALRLGTVQADGSISFGDEIRVNEHTDGFQRSSTMIQLADGRLLFTFRTDSTVDGDTSNAGIAARLGTLEADGSVTFGDEFRVNEHTSGFQQNPQVTQLADGRVLFTFATDDSTDGDTDSSGIAGRIGVLDGDGTISLADEFRVNAVTAGGQYAPQVTQIADGRVVFLFDTTDADEAGIGARVGTVNADGSVTFSDELGVNEHTASVQFLPQVLRLADDRILSVFMTLDNSDGDTSGFGISARLGSVNADGSITFGDEFRVNEQVVGTQSNPEVIQLQDGRLLFVFATDLRGIDGDIDGRSISARIGTLEADGSVSLSAEFRVNEQIDGNQSDPELTQLADGRVLISFSSFDDTLGDGSGESVSARLIEIDGSASDQAETLIALEPIQSLNGGDGDDLLIGFTTDDTMSGGAGSDTFLWRVGGGRDVIDGGNGAGSDSVELLGSLALDTFVVLSGTDAGIQLGYVGTADTVVLHNGAIVSELTDIEQLRILGLGGNDLMFGGDSDEEFIWRAGDGHDQVDGGAESTGDTMTILGNNNDEVFDIFSNAAAASDIDYQGPAEIILARNGFISAEINDIEEIVVNGGGGENTFNIKGSFAGTSLSTSTITLIGSSQDDVVNASELASPHRFIFFANGGDDEVFGDRSQDLIDVTGRTVSSVEEIEPDRFRIVLDDSSTITYSLAAKLVENAGTDQQISVNLAPFADDDAAGTDEDTSIDVPVGNGLLANDFDLDGGILAITKIDGTDVEFGVERSLASGATLVVNADGSYRYDPNGQFEALNAGQAAEDGFTYLLEDGQGGSATAQVIIQISGVTDTGGSVIQGTPDNDVLEGTASDDTIQALAGDDLIMGGAGFDIIDGDEGLDSVEYDLARGEIVQDSQADGSLLLGKPGGGTDTLIDIERIVLDDGNLLFDLQSQNLGFTYRIYAAAYGRTPDEGGLRFWTGVLDSFDANDPGRNKELFLAEQFLAADEFIQLYGANPTNEEYIEAMYLNVLMRLPDQGGYDFWVGGMEGGLGRDDILIAFAQSDENRDNTAPDIDDGVWVT